MSVRSRLVISNSTTTAASATLEQAFDKDPQVTQSPDSINSRTKQTATATVPATATGKHENKDANGTSSSNSQQRLNVYEDVTPATRETDNKENIIIANIKSVSNSQQQRLNVYNDIFNNSNENDPIIDENTQLLTSRSLNKSLYKYLQLQDNNYVLCMIDVDGLKNINEKLGYDGANGKISQIGREIYQFCKNNPSRLKGYKCNQVVTGKGDLFGVSIHCKNGELKRSEKYIQLLMQQIKSLTNETVSVGIAKMNACETYSEWKLRAFKNIQKVKGKGKGYDDYFSDIDIDLKLEKANVTMDKKEENDEKKQEEKEEERRLGTKEEFDLKLQEIANSEDENWIIAIMDIDDLGQFLFENDNDRTKAKPQIDKLETAMIDLFDVLDYGKDKNSKDKRYFGYNMTDGDEYAMILYDSKNLDECLVDAHDMLEGLRSRIAEKCQFTVSIGYSRIVDNDLGLPGEVFKRVNKHLKQAKKHGKNQIHFGQVKHNLDGTDEDILSRERADTFAVLNTAIEDKITDESLGVIEVSNSSCAVPFE